MPIHTVKNYSASWNFKKKEGSFLLFWEGPANPTNPLGNSNFLTDPITIEDPAEFQLMIDLLRNESPVYYDSGSKRLSVRVEPVGEEENSDEG